MKKKNSLNNIRLGLAMKTLNRRADAHLDVINYSEAENVVLEPSNVNRIFMILSTLAAHKIDVQLDVKGGDSDQTFLSAYAVLDEVERYEEGKESESLSITIGSADMFFAVREQNFSESVRGSGVDIFISSPNQTICLQTGAISAAIFRELTDGAHVPDQLENGGRTYIIREHGRALGVLDALKQHGIPFCTNIEIHSLSPGTENEKVPMTPIRSISSDGKVLTVSRGDKEDIVRVEGRNFFVRFDNTTTFSFSVVGDEIEYILFSAPLPYALQREIIDGAAKAHDMRTIVRGIMDDSDEESLDEYLGTLCGSGELLSKEYGQIFKAAATEVIDFDEVHEILGPVTTALLHECSERNEHRWILDDLLFSLRKAHERLYDWHDSVIEKSGAIIELT